jgi:hypothetical protein
MIGMLWFDNDPKKTIAVKIRGAIEYYKEKYGATPTVCYMNPAMLRQEPISKSDVGVDLITNKSLLYNHFLIGVSNV